MFEFATGRMGISPDDFWNMHPVEFDHMVEGRLAWEKQRRVELASAAIAISANSFREKVDVRGIYEIVVGEPFDCGDPATKDEIYNESRTNAVREREAEIRALIEERMTDGE